MPQRRTVFSVLALVAAACLVYAVASLLANGNSAERSPSDEQRPDKVQGPTAFTIESWRFVEDLDGEIAVFETVFWDLRDTESLRELIRTSSLVEGKTVLEIGTGTGLLALCCLQAGAERVVATDVNPAAVANAIYNADHLNLAGRLDVRLVPLDDSSAFSVIKPGEQFDLIISNPPWVNQEPKTIEEHALYDANFALMKSLFGGLRDHLKPGGRLLLAYGSVDAIKKLLGLAEAHQFGVLIHDQRDLDGLPEEFLPGMLLEVRLKQAVTDPNSH